MTMTRMGTTNSEIKLAAILLAAGYSSRMGTMKALLPVQGEPFLIRQIRLLQEAGIERIVVVTGHHAQQLISLLEQKTDRETVKIVVNQEYDKGMFSSIRAGARELTKWTADGFFLLPVDQPLRDAFLLKELARIFSVCKDSLVTPAYQGKKGHPPLIPMKLMQDILSFRGEDGIKGVLRKSAIPTVCLETGDPFSVMNLNLPEDYQRFLLELEQERVLPLQNEKGYDHP